MATPLMQFAIRTMVRLSPAEQDALAIRILQDQAPADTAITVVRRIVRAA